MLFALQTLSLSLKMVIVTKARFFLIVDLRDFFSDLGSGRRKKINKKALKMTS